MTRKKRDISESTTFFGLLKITTITPFLLTPIFYVSVVLAVIFYYFFRQVRDFTSLITYTSETVASISSTLLGIVIAGLAILISLAQGRLLSLFLHKNILQKFLFPFWVFTGVWALSTFLCILIKLIEFMDHKVLLYVFTFEVFVFMYALLGTVSLMGHAIRFGIYNAKFSEIADEKKTMND